MRSSIRRSGPVSLSYLLAPLLLVLLLAACLPDNLGGVDECDEGGILFRDDFSGEKNCGWAEYNQGGALVEIKEGEMILFSTSIVGLDETRFKNPLEVDFRRAGLKKDSLAFGTGVHMCSGHHLARAELRITLEEVLPRLKNLRVASGAEIDYASGGTVTIAGPLPLEWDV